MEIFTWQRRTLLLPMEFSWGPSGRRCFCLRHCQLQYAYPRRRRSCHPQLLKCWESHQYDPQSRARDWHSWSADFVGLGDPLEGLRIHSTNEHQPDPDRDLSSLMSANLSETFSALASLQTRPRRCLTCPFKPLAPPEICLRASKHTSGSGFCCLIFPFPTEVSCSLRYGFRAGIFQPGRFLGLSGEKALPGEPTLSGLIMSHSCHELRSRDKT